MGRMSREKGKRGEAEVVNLLKMYGFAARRGCQYKGGPDSPDVVGLPNVHIEVKRTERFDLYGALEQAQRDAGAEEIPVVFHRRNGKPWIIVMAATDYLKGQTNEF